MQNVYKFNLVLRTNDLNGSQKNWLQLALQIELTDF